MVTCHGCGQKYIGETGRPLHKRLDEHLRALWSPSSCPNNSFSHHGTLHHTYTRRSGLRPEEGVTHRKLANEDWKQESNIHETKKFSYCSIRNKKENREKK
ncbi:hypothetical protein Y032_0007g3375 [Ancylostoma ceylanicum]|uniref:Uncharacterized protein n=1 Tax=Ancylostoma ceylanicum TaxID=53326 RepID=A0A016VMR5_9BILA|nr:hypothetical protein Y032_0007g3375 [Ancylostoma ceylanicum]